MPSCIYLLTNTITQKQYVGYTSKPLNERIDEHNESAIKNRLNGALHKAIRKYGIDKFTSEIIYMSKDAHHCKNEAEVALIADYNTFLGSGYNMTLGGDGTVGRIGPLGPMFGKRHSLETKLKMSLSHKGKRCGKSNPMYGIKGSDHFAFGKPRSKETIDKISKSKIGTQSGANNPNHRHIMPEKSHLIDMINFLYTKSIISHYGVGGGTFYRWKNHYQI